MGDFLTHPLPMKGKEDFYLLLSAKAYSDTPLHAMSKVLLFILLSHLDPPAVFKRLIILPAVTKVMPP